MVPGLCRSCSCRRTSHNRGIDPGFGAIERATALPFALDSVGQRRCPLYTCYSNSNDIWAYCLKSTRLEARAHRAARAARSLELLYFLNLQRTRPRRSPDFPSRTTPFGRPQRGCRALPPRFGFILRPARPGFPRFPCCMWMVPWAASCRFHPMQRCPALRDVTYFSSSLVIRIDYVRSSRAGMMAVA